MGINFIDEIVRNVKKNVEISAELIFPVFLAKKDNYNNMRTTFLKGSLFIAIILAILGNFQTHRLNAQDIHFSQFYASPLTLNPSMTGMIPGCYRATVNFRNQWSSIPAPFTTVSAGFDMPFLRNIVGSSWAGGGILIFNDQAGYGNLNNLSVLGSLAAHLSIDRESKYVISLGGQGGWVHKNVNFAKLVFEEQLLANPTDPSSVPNWEAVDNNIINYFDTRAGAMVSIAPIKKISMYVGGALFHINKPEESFLVNNTNFLDPRTVFHAGFNLQPNRSWSIHPHGIYMAQTGTREIVVGLQAGYHFGDNGRSREEPSTAIYFGANYRVKDAINPILGVEYSNFKFGLSYDINISDLKVASQNQGGIELSLGYIGSCYQDSKRHYPPVSCPRF